MEDGAYSELTADQEWYVKRLAHRLIQWRKSGSVDTDDLISAARTRWWQYCMRHQDHSTTLNDQEQQEWLIIAFRQQVKFAMRDILRASTPVKVTRSYQAKMKAYESPYSVDLEHAINVRAGDEVANSELWFDVVASIQQLPQRDQIILSLFIEQGYNFTEISYAMDLSVSTVSRAYQRSLQIIKNNVEENRNTRKK
ncbi:RNA polymerase sigma factor [Sulfoacidibacillus ferrooxidans]|uniref:RNA polymerase sigma factor FliA n=1 Tax=Sulfoacidibacillus ferrooxidans TaxID=2005001 RepID=A0A9X1V8D1_9BACL|nr:sigma factor-like helix-turn-helix DNA-binding protein [Sulfoacidibacillus ferrooxidans]MCI0183486.1 RNA polymerase sigma factor FliA [Sulfoacidibacillus ferrooxidans]